MDIKGPGERIVNQVIQEAYARSFSASNALRNAALRVLRGQRSGRRYRVPYTRGNYVKNRKKGGTNARMYTASAPGEPPAARTGTFRKSWTQKPRSESTSNGQTVYPSIYTPYKVLAETLQDGRRDGSMAPRPFEEEIKNAAMPQIQRIYGRRYT